MASRQAGGAPSGSVPKGRFRVPGGAQVPTRELGRTGERVSIVGLGGYHLGIPTEEESVRIVRTALDHGMNFLDNCWDYHDGASEERMGKALQGGYRERAFLMTKLVWDPLESLAGISVPVLVFSYSLGQFAQYLLLLLWFQWLRLRSPEVARP